MNIDAVRADLEAYDIPPEAVLRDAVAHADALAPTLIELMSRVCHGVYLLPRERRLLFNGLHVGGAARETALYRPLLQLLRCPEEDLEPLLGDALTETLPQFVFAVFDGDAQPLIDVICDRSAGPFIRWGLFGVLARAVLDDAAPRPAAAAATERFARERLAEPNDPAWAGWLGTIVVLALDDQADLVRAAAAAGMLDDDLVLENWEARLAEAQADPAAARAMLVEEHFPVDDPVDALVRAFVRPPEQEANEDDDEIDQELQDAVLDLLEKRGLTPEDLLDGTAIDPPWPGGPLNEHALDDDEQAWLEGFLNSRQVPETTLSLDELDGFFTALVIDPTPIMPDTWMKEVWGTDDGTGPVYSSEEQRRFVLDLLKRYRDAIATSFAAESGPAPLLRKYRGEDDGLAWASGFLSGMDVNREVWERMADEAEGEGSALFGPIAVLSRTSDDDDLPDNLRDEDARQNAIAILPEILASMYRYFRTDASGRKPRPERRRKVGRNQPCPCGSGRKYKMCCGAAGADKTPPRIGTGRH